MTKKQKPLLLAQCKAYHPLETLEKQCETLIQQHAENSSIYISIPYLSIKPIEKKLASENISIGANNMLSVDKGTFTATIAGKMLAEAGAKFVLIGTTEERHFNQEKKQSFKAKLKEALKAGIIPFICISETWQEHEDELSKKVLSEQLKEMIGEIPPEELKGIHIVYDAIWINNSEWTTSDEILKSAYKTFKEAVQETMDPSILDSVILVVAVPTTTCNLTQVAAEIQESPFLFAGLSLGTQS